MPLRLFRRSGQLCRGLHAVRVAVQSSESPPELLARADVIVDGPDGALAWLEALDSTET